MVVPEPQVEALPADAEASDDLSAPYRIRAAKLERFIQYQEQTLVLYAQMLQDLARVDVTDGGPAPSVAVVKRHAEAQERTRRSLGLTERDVRELERVVGDVISRRALAGSLDGEDALRQLEGLAGRLEREQRVELDRTMAQLRQQQVETASLSEERRKYGDANVDLVLSREEVLTRQWNKAIATFAGTRPPKPEPAPLAAEAAVDGGTNEAPAPVAGSAAP